MSEIVERVAKAVFLHERSDGEWNAMNETGRGYYRDLARIAIAAMREPTEAMRAAVEGDQQIQCGLDDCNKHGIPYDAWELMIDAALT